MVKELIANNQRNLTLLNKLFHSHIVINICKILLGTRTTEDHFIWLKNKDGIRSVKGFYLTD